MVAICIRSLLATRNHLTFLRMQSCRASMRVSRSKHAPCSMPPLYALLLHLICIERDLLFPPIFPFLRLSLPLSLRLRLSLFVILRIF